eukprot:TRINITY_DN28398_c0_g1_i1.p1 TRINITY_DN28398_c0_g1~~TRINITY_DN28398_c0_g1_i1.p1  ORF type:complete len:1133 (-),score=93.32 TRINITY_DN28398_c0_g1_i1:208-3171(-)
MASVAERRYQLSLASSSEHARSKSGFAACLRHLPSSAEAFAFEVWKYVGDVTLSVAFFMGSFTVGGKHTTLTFNEKLEILRQLEVRVGALNSLEEDGPGLCCCALENLYSCSRTAAYSSLDALSFRESRGVCPSGFDLYPERCGPIVHHDLKFDNVVLSADSETAEKADVSFAPVVIDFGASAYCWSKNQGPSGYSVDWAPPWLEDKLSLDRLLCHSYDTYGIGVMHLVLELLRDLPPQQLLCDAASETHIPNGSDCELDPSFVGQAMIEDALLPINMLIHELRGQVLTPAALIHPDDFVQALTVFVSRSSTSKSEVRRLPLVMPSVAVIKDKIFPLVRECPNHLVKSSMYRLMICKGNVLERRIEHAGLKPFNFLESIEYEEVCSNTLSTVLRQKNACVSEWTLKHWRLIDAQDVDGLRNLVQETHYPSYMNLCSRRLPGGNTLLTLAARTCNKELVSVLLDSCGHAYAKDAVKPAAETFGCSDMLSFLYDDMDPTTIRKFKSAPAQATVLGATASTGDVQMVEVALSICERISIDDSFQDALLGRRDCCDPDDVPIVRAARVGAAAVIQRLLQARADVNVVDSKGYNLLRLAVVSGNSESVRILGAQHPPLVHAMVPHDSGTNEDGQLATTSLLHIAAIAGNDEVVHALLDLRADPCQKDDTTKLTPLQAACLQEPVSLQVVRLLQVYPDAVRVTSGDGKSLLSEVAERGQTDVLNALIKDIPDESLLFHDSNGGNALAAAAGAGKLHCVHALFEHVPVPAAWSMSSSELDPVIVSVARAQIQSIQLLLRLGFHLPSAWGDLRIPIAMLVGWGDGPHHRRDQRCAALRLLADHLGYEALDARDVFGVNALGRWAFDGDIDMVRCLDTILKVSICSNAAVSFRDARATTVGESSAWLVDAQGQRRKPLTALGIVHARLKGNLDDLDVQAFLRGGVATTENFTHNNRQDTYQEMGRPTGRLGQEAVLEYLVKKGCVSETASFQASSI